MATVRIREFRVRTEHGDVFAKSWTPADGARASAAPIILFHDSLGCVELWRDFPQQLAQASCRSVHAYDRLGFGRSDAHPARLAADFIHAEAHGASANCAKPCRLPSSSPSATASAAAWR
ncbi:alpha/beta hydrolase [Tahibacter harae]|uniref:Alpha/beta hydrolase n=1 Tax=Tahibacter harae TaxID=2963937 RepID=A0ABT1QUE6_9GAMM|nr:alpha/beta hydrolase [Tahibacter harae]MCQ4165891.1 alpha/beta hydrolase [Tahibacter harae]